MVEACLANAMGLVRVLVWVGRSSTSATYEGGGYREGTYAYGREVGGAFRGYPQPRSSTGYTRGLSVSNASRVRCGGSSRGGRQRNRSYRGSRSAFQPIFYSLSRRASRGEGGSPSVICEYVFGVRPSHRHECRRKWFSVGGRAHPLSFLGCVFVRL